ncbi:S-adenosyl-L-methionine-dependent methyltransferase [Ochromonadaceae sp. CCMP2298]|nr:S-adenosyl-L-methionine-dependent methyltransferase [Ochromonadaceae sp. CCMP2298]
MLQLAACTLLLLVSIEGLTVFPRTRSIAMSLTREPSLKERVADTLISGVFQIKPLFNMARQKARDSMVDRGSKIGVDWSKNIQSYNADMTELEQTFNLLSKTISYPDYYLQPFHAYEEGNLSWQAAMEVESAAVTVHAQIYAPPDELDPQGDFTLRDRFHQNMRQLLGMGQGQGQGQGQSVGFSPRRVLDIGCSTGLSTLKLHETFPEAEVVGLDLSPHMLAVAKYQLGRGDITPEARDARQRISYTHGAGESTSMAKGDVDLVSLSLVSHELPQAATQEILREAYRILPPNGAIAIMDMDPESPAFQRVAGNPFAFAAFKSTEPWIREYMSLDLYATLRSCGFTDVRVLANSPRHRTVVAFKK